MTIFKEVGVCALTEKKLISDGLNHYYELLDYFPQYERYGCVRVSDEYGTTYENDSVYDIFEAVFDKNHCIIGYRSLSL